MSRRSNDSRIGGTAPRADTKNLAEEIRNTKEAIESSHIDQAHKSNNLGKLADDVEGS